MCYAGVQKVKTETLKAGDTRGDVLPASALEGQNKDTWVGRGALGLPSPPNSSHPTRCCRSCILPRRSTGRLDNCYLLCLWHLKIRIHVGLEVIGYTGTLCRECVRGELEAGVPHTTASRKFQRQQSISLNPLLRSSVFSPYLPYRESEQYRVL